MSDPREPLEDLHATDAAAAVVSESPLEAPVTVDRKTRVTIGLYVALTAALAVLHLLVVERVGPMARVAKPIVEHALLAGALIGAVLTVTRTLNAFVVDRLASAPARFNLRRVASLARAVVIVVITLSLVFATWYTALLSLGVVSLILGFALQTPITSFIGWLYILVKNPYRVGERIRLGDAGGDVIDVSFLDTVLWEVGGPLVSPEEPSGRIIRIPNSLALSNAVYNYSTPRFPYVWNEVKLYVAYSSDLEFVTHTLATAAARHITPAMRSRLTAFRRAVARTPIDPRGLTERPVVVFRSHESSWLEASVRYLVDPREAAAVRAHITREALDAFGKASERVPLPTGAER